MLRWVLLALLLGICATAQDQNKKKAAQDQNKKKAAALQSLSRGWGNNISWVKNYEEGLLKMVSRNKPLMVIHHQNDCPFSQALKKAFVAEKNIQKMAKDNFIMLNLVEETSDKNLAPDGYYVPRILFVDPSKTVRTDISGRYTNRLYTYTPHDLELLSKNMKKAKVLLHPEL